MFRNPFGTRYFRGKEKDLVAEALTHVVAKGAVGAHHRHQGTRRVDLVRTLTIDHQWHRFAADRVGCLDADGLADYAWNEERVQSTPCVGGPPVGNEAVLRVKTLDRVAPKTDHAAAVVSENSWPRAQSLVHQVQGDRSDRLRNFCRLDRLAPSHPTIHPRPPPPVLPLPPRPPLL